MKKGSLICIILAVATLLGAIGLGCALLFKSEEEFVEPEGEDEEILHDLKPSITITNTSFFEDQFTEIDPEKGEHINITYDTFPRTENTSNLQSLGTAVFDIGGQVVTADAFYRIKNEALNDPNAGLGLLLYQSIQYKIANPDAKMRICFASYRVSPTAAVCVLPESRYYGYMRSLYGDGNDYDQNGFVRIAYMLVEAAKMGIDVTVVGQLNSYGVKQYNSEGNLKSVNESSYVTYFNAGLKQSCYEKYAPGKKVSDFMTFRKVEWDLEDKGGTDMMHLKSLTTSHYLGTDGIARENAIFFSSSNMDAIDYKGCNGNNGAQSGVVVTGHKELYNATVNYIDLIAKYYKQEHLYELRYLVQKRNTEQAELIMAGREKEIPDEEQITWLGSEEDKVFKLCFSAIGGDYDSWNTVTNPYCEQLQNLYDSALNYPDEYRVFAWNCPTYSRSFNVPTIMHDMVMASFYENRNPDNRLCIWVSNYKYVELESLRVSKGDIGFIKLKNGSLGVHSKDIVLSYFKDGERKYVSLLTSCNFHSGAMYYQTNSMLTITETDETGDVFYRAFGNASTHGCIVKE